VVFSDPRTPLPFGLGDFRSRQVLLDAANLAPAILASCSIPFWLDAVHDVPGAPRGAYWDGGITDYHLHLPYAGMTEGLVLYPHFQHAAWCPAGWTSPGSIAIGASAGAGQRGRAVAVSGLGGHAAPGQAARPRRLQALWRRRGGPHHGLAARAGRERAAGRTTSPTGWPASRRLRTCSAAVTYNRAFDPPHKSRKGTTGYDTADYDAASFTEA
jgi:hypothetical protein